MRKVITVIVIFVLISSCNKKKFFDGPNYYTDDFEAYSNTSDMLLPDDVLWSFTQITRTGNSISIDTVNPKSGQKCLKFVAVKSSSEALSKCSIAKHNMAFWEGETMRASAWYYMKGAQSAPWLFLMDFEEQTAIGAGPGMRIALVDNKLRIEHKFNERDILQASGRELDFPRDQWVHLELEVKLSKKHKGTVKLWQDGHLIINSTGNRTLPKDILYSLQGTKGMYSSIEIGITANSRDNDLTLLVDDIKFEKVN